MNATGTQQSKNGRCLFLDYAKALAIILMVLLHTISGYETLSSIVGTFHMAVFFLIGGIFFNLTNTSFRIILKKAVIQLLIPYFVFSIIAFSICWISPTLHPELYPRLDSFGKIFKAAFIGMFIGQDYFSGYSFMPLGPLWFLLALFWCRIIFYLWAKKIKYGWIIKCVIATAVVLIYIYHPLIFSLDGMAVSLPFFMIGYYAKDFFKNLSDYNTQIRIIMLIICTAILFLFTESRIAFGGGRISGLIPIAYIRGLAGCIVVMIICTFIHKFKILATPLSVLGASTLTVLGLHFHFLYPSKVFYLTVLNGDAASIHIVYALIVTIITVTCLTFVHKFLNAKAPFMVGKGF